MVMIGFAVLVILAWLSVFLATCILIDAKKRQYLRENQLNSTLVILGSFMFLAFAMMHIYSDLKDFVPEEQNTTTDLVFLISYVFMWISALSLILFILREELKK